MENAWTYKMSEGIFVFKTYCVNWWHNIDSRTILLFNSYQYYWLVLKMFLVFDVFATEKYWNTSHNWCICLLESNEMLLVCDVFAYRKVLKMLPYFGKNVYCKVLKMLMMMWKKCINALSSLSIVKSVLKCF